MSNTEQGSDDAGLWDVGFGGGTTGVVVEDLGEDGGVDCYSCRGSTAGRKVMRSAGKQQRGVSHGLTEQIRTLMGGRGTRQT